MKSTFNIFVSIPDMQEAEARKSSNSKYVARAVVMYKAGKEDKGSGQRDCHCAQIESWFTRKKASEQIPEGGEYHRTWPVKE